MVCRKCKYTITDGAEFCPNCGHRLNEEVKQNIKCCPSCGEAVNENARFCTKCGAEVAPKVEAIPHENIETKDLSDSKIKHSYFVSIISAVLSFIIRIAMQDTYYSWENLLDNRKIVGIDSDTKPFVTIIPVIAAVIVSLMIVPNKEIPSEKKTRACIIHAIFIALAIIFIWFDLPYAIFDF